MHSFPTFHPVIESGGSYAIERILELPGEVCVVVGETVTPSTVVGRSKSIEVTVKINVAYELGLEANDLNKHLLKPIGSTLTQGEVIAQARHGLRTAKVQTPTAGTLVAIDELTGDVTVSSHVGPQELNASVYGTVEQIVDGKGVVLRATGDRYYGIVGCGDEAVGELVLAVDRHDRELSPEHVDNSWSGKIVLAGKPLGVPALEKLADARVVGVIVGSFVESEVRRFVSATGQITTTPPGSFWFPNQTPNHRFSESNCSLPFVMVATEGFGHQPMAAPLFASLSKQEGKLVSIFASTKIHDQLKRPAIYMTHTGERVAGETSDEIVAGRTVRVVDPSQVGVTGITTSDVFDRKGLDGKMTSSVEVALHSGEPRIVPVNNVEVIS